MILASGFESNGNYSKALEYYKKLEDKDKIITMSKHIEDFKEMGITYYEDRKYEKAAENLKKHLEKDGSDIQVHVTLGDIYRKKNKYSEAIQHYQKDKNTLSTKKKLAECFLLEGETAFAYSLLKTFDIESEEDKKYLYDNAKNLARNSRYSDAKELNNIIMKCISRSKKERYQSCEEIIGDLL